MPLSKNDKRTIINNVHRLVFLIKGKFDFAHEKSEKIIALALNEVCFVPSDLHRWLLEREWLPNLSEKNREHMYETLNKLKELAEGKYAGARHDSDEVAEIARKQIATEFGFSSQFEDQFFMGIVDSVTGIKRTVTGIASAAYNYKDTGRAIKAGFNAIKQNPKATAKIAAKVVYESTKNGVYFAAKNPVRAATKMGTDALIGRAFSATWSAISKGLNPLPAVPTTAPKEALDLTNKTVSISVEGVSNLSPGSVASIVPPDPSTTLLDLRFKPINSNFNMVVVDQSGGVQHLQTSVSNIQLANALTETSSAQSIALNITDKTTGTTQTIVTTLEKIIANETGKILPSSVPSIPTPELPSDSSLISQAIEKVTQAKEYLDSFDKTQEAICFAAATAASSSEYIHQSNRYSSIFKRSEQHQAANQPEPKSQQQHQHQP